MLNKISPIIALFVILVLVSSLGCPPATDNPPSTDPPASQAVLNMEQSAFNLVNNERTSRSLSALIMDEAVRSVARKHSEDMLDRNFFSHTNPDGKSPFDRLRDAGITYNLAGENIAYNYNYSNPATTAVTGWMDSSGHRANILRAEFARTGMGVATNGAGKWYFTQVFTRTGKSLEGETIEGFWEEPVEAIVAE